MRPGLQTPSFDGAILQRGFWLYAWEITPAGAAPLYYVGRTGDSPSKVTCNARVAGVSRLSPDRGYGSTCP